MNSSVKKGGIVALLIGMGGLFFIAWQQSQGFSYFQLFRNARAQFNIVQGTFEPLESLLLEAIRAYKNPIFCRELGRFYLDKAMAEDKLNHPDRRDAYLDKAADAAGQSIRRNPADAWAYYDLAKIWMLYNKPLLTYGELARSYLLTAMKLHPSSDFLNLNGLFLFLIQWDSLTEDEKGFVFGRIERKFDEKAEFIGMLKGQWKTGGGNPIVLKSILMSDSRLWARISGRYK